MIEYTIGSKLLSSLAPKITNRVIIKEKENLLATMKDDSVAIMDLI